MIAEKLLACATPACATSEPLDPRNTLFLAFAQCPAGGAPEAIIGQLSSHAGISLNGTGGAIVQNAGGAVYVPLPAPSFGAGDFLLDIAFDGETVPSVNMYGSFSVSTHVGNAYVSTSGGGWDYVIPISPPPGQNHVAIGRQAGVVQVWLNGSRVFRAEDAATGANPTSPIFFGQHPKTGADMTVHSVRLCYGVNLYGDSATITVPTLPLGIV